MRHGLFRTLMCAAALTTAIAVGGTIVYAGDGFTPALDTQTECELRIDGGSPFAALEDAFARFKAYYPNAKLTYTVLEDYNNAIGSALSGEEQPDLYGLTCWMIGKDEYQPLLDAAENLADPSLHLDLSAVKDQLLYKDAEGEVPAVPILANTYGMLVNEDIFADAGDVIPKTYSELVAVCQDLQDYAYDSPVMGYNGDSQGLTNAMFFPLFVSKIANDPAAIDAVNALDPSTGNYMLPALSVVDEFMEDTFVDIYVCSEIKTENPDAILRFFKGDVPMLFTNTDAVSATKQLESSSDSYASNPFKYSFYPIPMAEDGGYFLYVPSYELAVNKNSANIGMANEFLRFLLNTEELNQLALQERLLTTSTDLTADPVYASFASVPDSHVICIKGADYKDSSMQQCREAAYLVANGDMEPEEAIAKLGTF